MPRALQNNEQLEQEEEFAIEKLSSWLCGVENTFPENLESLLDESQRAYLLSFRDRSDSTRRQYVVVSHVHLALARLACRLLPSC